MLPLSKSRYCSSMDPDIWFNVLMSLGLWTYVSFVMQTEPNHYPSILWGKFCVERKTVEKIQFQIGFPVLQPSRIDPGSCCNQTTVVAWTPEIEFLFSIKTAI
ncbi:hypothetical protein ROZALSC1DRAFT_20497 [Rozella allomycis CSF55]|uniref:Uncharacterized protein n=1 Tax=Rozella allomycis (strain CSF55) TaxID=988480 RepID=A0A4P9YNZ2_ROZAC|nr:hypothetical protein ROZALSC1DRAFT_20497 [Rozella allomycis CSF55]